MILVITGPTGVGKTKLSVQLAKKLNGEIINADSTQVYKEMNIATAKVTEEEKEGIPHHLFDIKNKNEDYSIYNYQKDCRAVIAAIEKKGKMPIIVGGTGLYIKAALFDYKLTEESVEKKEYLDYSNEVLYKMLTEIDPNTDIHPNNRKRMIRALNYYANHSEPLSSKEKATKPIYDCLFIGLTTDRELLYNKINERVDKMINNGLIEEAKKIYDTNIRSKAVMTPIGYKELFPYFEDKISLEEAVKTIKKNSRNYAKRQYTFFNHQLKVNWFSVNYEDFKKTIEEVFRYIEKRMEND